MKVPILKLRVIKEKIYIIFYMFVITHFCKCDDEMENFFTSVGL